MADFEKKLSGEEVRFEYVLLQRGRDNLFPARGEFDITFGDKTFKAFIRREEDKSMGPKSKVSKFVLKFVDEVPKVFEYRKTLKFEGEDKVWKVSIIEE